MKRKNPNQTSFDFDGQQEAHQPSTPEASKGSPSESQSRASTQSTATSRPKDTRQVIVFTDGSECPIPTRWPTNGGNSRDRRRFEQAIKDGDWRTLRSLPMRWFCWSCVNWHDYSEWFFTHYTGNCPYK